MKVINSVFLLIITCMINTFVTCQKHEAQLFDALLNDKETELLNLIKEVDLSTKIYNGTPLYWASSFCNKKFVKILLKHGAKETINIPFGHSQPASTPLMAATKSGCLNVVELLLSSGANPKIVDPSNKTPFQLAVEKEAEYAKKLGYDHERTKEYRAIVTRLKKLNSNKK